MGNEDDNAPTVQFLSLEEMESNCTTGAVAEDPVSLGLNKW